MAALIATRFSAGESVEKWKTVCCVGRRGTCRIRGGWRGGARQEIEYADDTFPADLTKPRRFATLTQ